MKRFTKVLSTIIACSIVATSVSVTGFAENSQILTENTSNNLLDNNEIVSMLPEIIVDIQSKLSDDNKEYILYIDGQWEQYNWEKLENGEWISITNETELVLSNDTSSNGSYRCIVKGINFETTSEIYEVSIEDYLEPEEDNEIKGEGNEEIIEENEQPEIIDVYENNIIYLTINGEWDTYKWEQLSFGKWTEFSTEEKIELSKKEYTNYAYRCIVTKNGEEYISDEYVYDENMLGNIVNSIMPFSTIAEESEYIKAIYKDKAFDIKGKDGDYEYLTTFSSNGYFTKFQQDQGSLREIIPTGEFQDLGNGLKVKVNLEVVYGGRYVKITYTVKNDNGNKVDFKLGSHADIKIDNVDNAPISATDTGLTMSDGIKYTFNLVAPNVSTLWYGKYPNAMDNVFNDRGDREDLTGEDSEAAWSWHSSVGANSEWSNFVLIGAGELPDPPKVPEINTDIAADCFVVGVPKTVTGTGDPEAIAHISIAGKEYEAEIDDSGKFSLEVTVPKTYLPNTAELTYWATTNDGGISEIKKLQVDVCHGADIIPDFTQIDNGNLNMIVKLDPNNGGETITVTDPAGDEETLPSNEYIIDEKGTYTIKVVTAKGAETEKQVIIRQVAFDSGITRQLVEDGGRLESLPIPEKIGYEFDYWQENGAEYDINTIINEDKSLVAKWSLKAPTVNITADNENPVYNKETVLTLTAIPTHESENIQSYTYQWYKDDVSLDGKTDATITLSEVTENGTYKVEVKAIDNEGIESSVGSSQYNVNIKPKEIYATWINVEQIYGENTDIEIILSDIIEGDIVNYTTSVDSWDVGEHEITAILDNLNYKLVNNKETLVIQKKPVIFVVRENIYKEDGNVHFATVETTDCTDDDYTVMYKKDGEIVTAPKEAGKYEIWVEITNENYRHKSKIDGEAIIAGELVITDQNQAKYKIQFDKNGGEGTDIEEIEAVPNTHITLPESTFTKENYKFDGWKCELDNKVYQEGDIITTVNQNMVFIAQWKECFNISGEIVDKDGNPVEGVVVELWLGANKVNEAISGEDGKFIFEDLEEGIYNIVAKKEEIIVTSKVEIKDKNENIKIILPDGCTNSQVEVTPGSPDVVVGNLDKVFEQNDDEVFTEEDEILVDNGGTVEIIFYAEEKEKDEVEEDYSIIEENLDEKENIGILMDYSIEKRVIDNNIVEESSISELNTVLEIILPLDTDLQNKDSYAVKRIHENMYQEIMTTPNADGEHYVVSNDKTYITIYAKNFSTYVVTYKEKEVQTIPSGGGGSSEDKKDEEVIEKVPCERNEFCPMHPYIDVTPNDWYHDGVHYCLENGFMKGTENNVFSPEQPITRGMIVTILYMHDGAPEITGENVFLDVDDSAYYKKAVVWANSNDVAKGYPGNLFKPEDKLTREELATMLASYQAYKDININVEKDNISKYADKDKISDWAIEKMNWSIDNKIILGDSDGLINPKNFATRAQVATMIMNMTLNNINA